MSLVFDAPLVFSALGPAFLVAGAWRCVGPRRNPLQGRTWLIVGAIFCVVALYLWWSRSPPP